LTDLITRRIAKRYQDAGDGFPASIFGRSVDGRRQHRSYCKAGGEIHGQWPQGTEVGHCFSFTHIAMNCRRRIDGSDLW
jgi:hypothetical protein